MIINMYLVFIMPGTSPSSLLVLIYLKLIKTPWDIIRTLHLGNGSTEGTSNLPITSSCTARNLGDRTGVASKEYHVGVWTFNHHTYRPAKYGKMLIFGGAIIHGLLKNYITL